MSLPPSNPLGAKLCCSLVVLPANALSVGVVLAQTPLGRQRVAAGPTLQDDEPQLALILHLSREVRRSRQSKGLALGAIL
jgi:hypothetical protein